MATEPLVLLIFFFLPRNLEQRRPIQNTTPIYDLNSDGQIGFGDFLTFVAGFGSDGTQWYIPITFENHTAQILSIAVGTETQTLLTQTIQAGITLIRVPIPRDIIASRDPTSTHPIPIWAQVADFIQTRSTWISLSPPA